MTAAWCLVPGLSVLKSERRVTVSGRPRDTLFEGGSVRVVTAVLEALRERPRTAAELAEDLGIPRRHVDQVLSLAAAERVVEPAHESARAHAPRERFLARVCGRERGMTTRAATDALAACRLALPEDASLAAHVEALAGAVGVDTGDRGATLGLVAGAGAGGAPIDQICERLAAGTSVMPVCTGIDAVTLGPLLDGADRRFVEATWKRMAGALSEVDRPTDAPAGTPLATPARVAMLAVSRLVSLRVRAVPASAMSMLQIHDFAAWRTGEELCAPVEVDDDAAPKLPQLYERLVEPRRYDPRHDEEATPTDLARMRVNLEAGIRSFPTHPHVDLPFVERLPESAAFDERCLAYLLQRVTGFHHPDEPRRRWVASGGALGSTSAFVTVHGPSSPYVMYYEPDLHRLVYVERPADWSAHRLSASTHLLGARAVSLLLVANLAALRPKYGAFSLKLAHLDAGCAAAQAMLLAPQLGARGDVRYLAGADPAARRLPLRAGEDLAVAEIVLTASDGTPA